MAQFQILYWHDIPVQVKAKAGRERVSKPLPDRFQIAVDNAAMAAGLVGSDEYTDLFQWSEAQEREGSAEEVATAVAAELETQYPRIPWRETVAAITSKP
ncbi:MAG: virulence factor [Ardenticatenaceae bacterium]|nr:virulence factor [Ardenticatenaceae bacterium]MCB9442927.1 virulence factor [Ardenticatenaceae bacterium]